jgi:hypothetical protein
LNTSFLSDAMSAEFLLTCRSPQTHAPSRMLYHMQPTRTLRLVANVRGASRWVRMCGPGRREGGREGLWLNFVLHIVEKVVDVRHVRLVVQPVVVRLAIKVGP